MNKMDETIRMKEDLKLDLETLETVAGGIVGGYTCTERESQYQNKQVSIFSSSLEMSVLNRQ